MNSPKSPTPDILVSRGPVSTAAMSANSSVGGGSGKEGKKEATLDDVVSPIAAMEETVWPLVPLVDRFVLLETAVMDQGRDQTALHVVLMCIEAAIHGLGRANDNHQGVSGTLGSGARRSTKGWPTPPFTYYLTRSCGSTDWNPTAGSRISLALCNWSTHVSGRR
jgi:hypothetical protein